MPEDFQAALQARYDSGEQMVVLIDTAFEGSAWFAAVREFLVGNKATIETANLSDMI